MRWQDNTVAFDAEYEPDLFRAEKEKNKQEFLNLYNTRLDYSGNGTEEDPFLISSYEDICRLRDCVDIGVTYRDYYFKQTENIFFPDGVNWNPIGSVMLGFHFDGNYDGDGHIISNIYCEDSHAGLFSVLGGEVRNLGIESGIIKGDYIGSIASHGSGRIINCYNKAAVCGNYRAGGIADHFWGTILFSWNFGEISGTKENTYLGGIVSYGAGDIEHCHSTAGDNVVNPVTFSGTLIDSDIIEADQIPAVANGDYKEYARYDGDKIIDFDQIVFLRPENSSLVYDTIFVPRQFTDAKNARRLPEYMLLGMAVIFGTAVYCLVGVRRRITMGSDRAIASDLKNKVVICTEETVAGGEAVGVVLWREKRRRLMAIALMCGILAVTFRYVNNVLNDKLSVVMLKNWEKDENGKADLVFLGPSTMQANVEHAWLWKKYGIASYNLGMSSQAMYDAYHRLIEAEKSHSVPMVVLDMSPIRYSWEYTDYQAKLENVSALNWSWNKLRYVQTAMPIEERLYYYLGFPVYHDRYHEVSKWDYQFVTAEGRDDKGTRWRYYNKVEFAEEYGVPYVDFNLYDEEIGILPSDFADDHHLNISGARKCADFLGEYLVSHYDLTDHRGDTDYSSWYRFSTNRENLYLRAITEKDDYFKELARDNKSVMAFPYRLPQSTDTLQEQLQTVSYFDWDAEDAQYGEENAESFTFGDNTVVITKDYGNCRIDLNDGADVIHVTQPGILLVVYDSINDEIADIVLLERDSGYTLKHLYSP